MRLAENGAKAEENIDINLSAAYRKY